MMAESLPYLLSSFIGRQTELAAVSELLGAQRLLTLTGPGGAGKTRLALAAAAEVGGQYPGGIFLVELASLSDAGLVPQSVATAAGLREQPGQAWPDTLVEGLRPRQALLLLDNCEHLLLACAQLADALLRACPRLTILATSREPLGLLGEVAWPVPPLSLPAADGALPALLACDAVQLFVARATTATPTFALTPDNAAALSRLCHKLDGLPLAIELAAARTRVLSVAQIAARLESSLDLLVAKDPTLPPRQRTLAATIDWSYQALSAEEATLFRALSVFAGGFTLAAVEAISGQQEGAGRSRTMEPLDVLAQLVDKSLVVVAAREPEPAYRLLETVRHFAGEKLRAAGEATAVQRRHARYYHQLAQAAEPFFRSGQRAQWQAKLEVAYDNVLAALACFAANQDVVAGGEMVWWLRWFFYFRGTVSEVGRQARIFLALPDAPGQAAVRARLHWCTSANAWVFGDYAQAYESAARGRTLAEAAADHIALAYLLTLQGLTGTLSKQGDDHLALQQQAIHLLQNAGDRWGEALARYWLGECLRLHGKDVAAMSSFAASQGLFRHIGDDWGVSLSLQGMGAAAYQQENHALARSHLEEALLLRRASQDHWLIAQTLATLATVLQAQGERATAVAHFQEAHTLYQEMGDEYGCIYALFKLGQLAEATGEQARARAYYQDCLALAEALEHPRRIAECRAALAQLQSGQPAAAPQPALRIAAFGPGEVRRDDGRLITAAEWSYARVRELFFYLLDGGPRSKGQIGLAFWPDASPARLRRNLHDTLYQLRKTLGRPEWIVYENGRYAFNQSLPYQYDVAAFSRHLKTPTVTHLQQAIDLYQADFLAEFDSEWCLLRREALRQHFLEAFMQLGRLLAADGRHAEAGDVYRQVIHHDNLLEEAHREWMRCLAKMGESARALRHYQELMALLEAELGVAPSPATTGLYERLRRGDPP